MSEFHVEGNDVKGSVQAEKIDKVEQHFHNKPISLWIAIVITLLVLAFLFFSKPNQHTTGDNSPITGDGSTIIYNKDKD